MPTQNVTAGLQGRVTMQANSVTNWLSQVRNASTGTGANTYSSSAVNEAVTFCVGIINTLFVEDNKCF